MGIIKDLPIVLHWEDMKMYLKFSKRRLTLVTESGLLHEYMFITLENKNNKRFKVTGYSNYFLQDKLIDCSYETLDYHAKIIVSFLNYIFIEKFNEYKITSISDLKIEHGDDYLMAYSGGEIGSENKTKATFNKVKQVLLSFYKFLVDEELTIFIKEGDLISKNYTDNGSSKRKGNKDNNNQKSVFRIRHIGEEPVDRIKSISLYLFTELLKVCDEIKRLDLKLMICLQAFGGLRRGEVCNVRKDILKFGYQGFDLGWFTIDLREEKIMRTDLKSTGKIKKHRVQPIHPVFLDIFKDVYDRHMNRIKEIKDPYGAIFINRDGNAMTDNSYERYFGILIQLLIKRLNKKGDFRSVSEANILMSARINTHVLRHFFTQFVAGLESTKTPTEIAYWRGDSSLDSALTYLKDHPQVDEKIKHIQKSVFEDIVTGRGKIN